MPTLSASTSVFQLAFGINAVISVLISEFENVRKEAADSLLRKIREYRPDFDLKERDRLDFMDFTFRSSRGLRHAKAITWINIFFSLMLCALSLACLCWAALRPDEQISSKLFLWFVVFTFFVGPLFYFIRNRLLKWLYSVLVSYGTNQQNEALLFAECVDIYLETKRNWAPIEQQLNEATLKIPLMIWKIRLARIRMRLISLRERLRTLYNSFQSMFKAKPKP
jgi:hypothetical protein